MIKEKTKIINSVRFLALCPLAVQAPNGRDCNPSRVKMHRVLKEETYYNFTSDFKISKDKKTITIANNTPKELYEIHQKYDTIEVNVSAIVGENGSGKSTIIDYIIRIINNLSAVLFGEDYYNSSSEHLHYVQGVYAEFYVLIDSIVFGIVCKGEELIINQYKSCTEDHTIFVLNDTKPFNNKSKNPCIPNKECFDILSKFCYTIIVNYSLYSFDTSSYINELTEDDKEIRISKKGIKEKLTSKDFAQIKKNAETNNDFKEYYDAKSWLPGILQKYDAYQIPILITPVRKKGQVNQRKEYAKAKEKLLSLALLRNEKDNRYFTHINNKEIIDKITLSLDPECVKENYLSIFKQKLNLDFSPTVCMALFNLVRNVIKNKFAITDSNNEYVKIIWYYIVYKFFYIILTYPEFYDYRQLINRVSSRLNVSIFNEIKKAVEKVCDIHSHVTRHFFRSIFYLKYDLLRKNNNIVSQPLFNDKEGELTTDIDIDSYSRDAYKIIKLNSSYIHYVDELMPPPIFSIDFKLYSNDDNEKKNVIPFETLSSGEKQITLSLSTLYYYLTNLDSTSNEPINQGKEEKDNEKNEIISYEHVCVIFDELELYYHPEMQRTFVNRLLTGLKQLEFRNIKSIQLIMATHSPFILSDVPKTNVLFLERDGKPREEVDTMHTFGANIHTMLEHSFFLKQGTMGAFAKKVIGEIEACLDVYRELNKQYIKIHYDKLQDLIFHNEHDCMKMFHGNKKGFDLNEFIYSYPKERIKATIDLFDEPILKKVLLNDFYEVFPEEKNKETLINTLEHQLAELKKTAQSIKEINSLNDTIEQLEIKIKDLKNEK